MSIYTYRTCLPVISYEDPLPDSTVVFDIDHVQHYTVQVQALTQQLQYKSEVSTISISKFQYIIQLMQQRNSQM